MRFFLTCIVLFASRLVCAQHFDAFTTIESINGLSENSVRSIDQLPDGRMAVLTRGMLNLYNGSSFQYIHLNDENLYQLPGYSGFHHIYIENEGRFWIKKKGQLMLVDMVREQFELQPEKVLTSLGITEPLADFFMDSERDLWLITLSGKLLYRSHKQKRTITFLGKAGLNNNIDDPLYDIGTLGDDVYLFYRSGLMVCYDIGTRKERYRLNALEEQNGHAYQRTMYIVKANSTFYMIRNGKRGIMLAYDVKLRKWNRVVETSYWLNSLSADQEGNMALSSKEGLWMIDRSLKMPEFVPTLHLVDGRSINTEVSSVFYDTQGGLWVGTLNKGLLYHHPDRFRFNNIGKSLFPVSENGNLLVTCFSENQGGDILVGTRKGLFRYFPAKRKLLPFSNQLSYVNCNSIFTDSKQRIWLCTTSGLYIITGNAVRQYPVGNINTAFQTPDGTFYLGTEDKGLLVFDALTGHTSGINTDRTNKNVVRSVRQMIVWKDKILGISEAGLFVYDPQNQVLEIIGDESRRKRPMFRHNNHDYNCLFIDSRGLLWFGTQDGLNVWNEQDKSLHSFHTESGLVNNAVQAITEDAQKEIWVSTANGISHIQVHKAAGKTGFNLTGFNKYDGVIRDEFLECSSLVTTDGRLLMGGIEGFNELELKKNTVPSKKLNPILISFQVMGKEMVPLASGSTILKYNQNFITIGFSALNYVNPERTFYKYKLDGVDNEWHLENTQDGMGRAIYTKLAPGTYTFMVRASDNGMDWNGKLKTLSISIKAPWWQTNVAIFIYCIAASILTYLLYSWFAKKNAARQARQQQEKLDELKFSFFTNISHELRTPLALMITPLEAILKRVDDLSLSAQLKGVHRNASTLLNRVNQLLNFRRLASDHEMLHLSFCNLNEYIENVCRPFEHLAASKEITFRWICPTGLWLYLDSDKFGIILNNLLSNAFKYTPVGGDISITVTSSKMEGGLSDMVKVNVSDTGYGIPDEDIPEIFNRFFQAGNQGSQNVGSGIGLHLVKAYIEMHKGIVKVKSALGAGTEFILYIPSDLKPEPSEITKVNSHSGEAEHAIKILLAEDNDEFRNFLSAQLAEQYRIITAVNGQEALNIALSQIPDLVISDVMMPEMGGLELCEALKKNVKTSHIPVILLTARSSEEKHGYQVGADVYVTKPFNLEILLVRIHNLIEQQQQRKHLYKKAIIVDPNLVTTSAIDEKLIQRALQCIEKNMNNPAYSVEELSSDMHMERSGLYRKLMAIVGETPSAFMRTVRLKKAAQLLLAKEYTIAEIADRVGFSNAAYFSKCFQEEFGKKPSHYADSILLEHKRTAQQIDLT